MSSTELRLESQTPGKSSRTLAATDALLLVVIAALMTLLHLLTNARYGFHRDELQFLSDGRHLDWGYVVYPPFTPLLARLSLTIFGPSLVGLRLLSDLAQGLAIILTGLMARDLGGRRLAQVAAGLAVALSPISIHCGTQFIYTSFDYLWWVLTAWLLIRLLNTGKPHWWLAIGAALGVGLMTKYTIGAFVVGILGAFLFPEDRRCFRSRWFWAGVCVALGMVLPNVLWQFQHQFISLHWMHAVHDRDVRMGRADGFVLQQFFVSVNIFAAPLWIVGGLTCLRSPGYRRLRPLAWAFLISFAILLLMRARPYYLAPAFPMLIAVGAARSEQWLSKLRQSQGRTVMIAYFSLLGAYALLAMVYLVPLAASGPIRKFALAHNWDFREEIGWEQLVKTVASVRDALPESTRSGAKVLVRNYGEEGAIELYGAAYQLPTPMGGANSAWLRGYPDPPPTTLIVVGVEPEEGRRWFTSCYVAARVRNSEGIPNLESESIRSSILVCGPPRSPWPVFWREFRNFG